MRLFVAAALVLSAGVATSAVAPLTASASIAVRTDYPSWDDVNAAKANEATKAAEVQNITSLIGDLQQQAAELGDVAIQKGNEYLKATAALQSATQVADTARQRADDASTKAAEAKKQFAQLTVELYRSGGNQTANLFLSGAQADTLLDQLGTLSKLTQQSARLSALATSTQNLADTLNSQAGVAESARAQLNDAAEQAAADATAAQQAADAEVATQQAQSDVLFAQLASLKDTTAAVEQQYQLGVEAARQAAELAAAKEAAANAGDGNGNDSSAEVGGGSGGTSVAVSDPQAAKNYAQGQVSARGWGSDQFQCLLNLWNRESGWRANALNESSGAYGIPQSLPASKMASAGADYRTNAATQINWGLAYITGRYGNPCGAWAHSQNTSPHWY
ncbi:hypothetical protein B7R25_05820 [Subtercola boreus]|uniref:Transglycosylase SLT domain-containing protein n=1 Tax=Subtercola boreus TaxID=120213 RepID=A0A3E0WDG2_9MICO|nr:hypothetical protein B7R24_05750 [Subtercola boreus]RFA21898.1 hypothetical protein B7R23_05695 [Subtercola boreus]RFA27846.1 hypothetical protein B7R25_05820 [Subtercola boreus]